MLGVRASIYKWKGGGTIQSFAVSDNMIELKKKSDNLQFKVVNLIFLCGRIIPLDFFSRWQNGRVA